MRMNTEKLLRNAKKDYERTWVESARFLKKKGRYFSLSEERKSHPLFDLIIRIRNILLEMGFREVITPIIIDEGHVYLQFGPAAPVILDRVFYLAGLPRADLGISKEKTFKIKEIIPTFKETRQLERIFRRYKKGEIGSDDLFETVVEELKVQEGQATQIISLFSEFKELRPMPTKLTLRSHTTSAWFPLLKEMRYKEAMPLQLFSIGPKFRREHRLDANHLNVSWTASIVVMTEEISLEDGESIVEDIFKRLGFNEVEFRIKKSTSKYYAPQMEFEVFIRHPKTNESIEVGDGGLYNPISLAKYDIPYPVFNFGLGVERVSMIKTGIMDIRKLVYPQLYLEAEFTDEQIARMVKVDQIPSTTEGKKLVDAIVQTAVKNANQLSPCEFLVYNGKFLNRNVEVYIYEPETGKKLIGPAALNMIYVYDGNILAIPERGLEKVTIVKKARDRGVSTGIRCLDAIASLAVAKIEKEVSGKIGQVNVETKIAKLPSDVNVKIDDAAQYYITRKKKSIMIKGPLFVRVKAKISEH